MIEQKAKQVFKPLTEREQWLTGAITDIAVNLHKSLGPALAASVYKTCFCYELDKKNILYTRNEPVNIQYNSLTIKQGLQLDMVIENLVIIEIKAQDHGQLLWQAELLSYLKLSGRRLGYILNFRVPLMKDGIKRMIFQ